MANRYANIPGASKISQTYNLITEGFDKVQQDVDQLQDGLAQEIADREAAVQAVDERVDQIISEPSPNKDPELVDIRTPDSSYTPGRTINVAGDVTRDMQAQLMSHKADYAQFKDEVEAKLQGLAEYSVLSYGAKGDGVTDDSNAFQLALDAAEADGGGVVWVPVGLYLLKKTIYIPEGVNLNGAGKGTILKGSRPSQYMRTALISNKGQTASGFDGHGNFSISNLSIDTPTNGIVLNHSKNVVLRNIWGLNSGYHYIDVACKNLICDNLFLIGECGTSPFQINAMTTAQTTFDGTNEIFPNYDGTGTEDVYVTNSIITSPTRASDGREADKASVHFHHEAFYDNLNFENVIFGGALYGAYKDTDTTLHNVKFINCTFKNPQRGIWFNPAERGEGLNVDNCTFELMGARPITVHNQNKIKITNCNLASSGARGIAILKSSDVIIDKVNLDLHDAEIGIYVGEDICENISVKNVRIKGSTTSDCIQFDQAEARNVVFENIRISGTHARGIRFRPASVINKNLIIKGIQAIDATFGNYVLAILDNWEDIVISKSNMRNPSSYVLEIRGSRNVLFSDTIIDGVNKNNRGLYASDGTVAIMAPGGTMHINNCIIKNAQTGIEINQGFDETTAYAGVMFINCTNDAMGTFVPWSMSQ